MKLLSKIFVIAGIFYSCRAKRKRDECTEWSCDYGAECLMTSSLVRRCVCPDMPCSVEDQEAELCSTEGVTYVNACQVRKRMCELQRWIEIQHVGSCGVERCEDRWDCLFDGDCINGECVCVPCRDVLDRKVYYLGEYANTDGADRALKHTSVCGSDGITYESECHMRYHACMAKTIVVPAKMGVCHNKNDRSPEVEELSHISLPANNVLPRSVVSKRYPDCAQIHFQQCVSKRHPRLRYMGTYQVVSNMEYLESPVYKLLYEGSTGDRSWENRVRRNSKTPVYLSRMVTKRHPKGSWVVGSKIGSGKGWLGNADGALLPQDVSHVWKSTTKGANMTWVKEPSVSLHCGPPPQPNIECVEAYEFDKKGKSNWQNVVPRTPLFVLKVTQSFRNKRRKKVRKIRVGVIAKRKTHRFISYILKLSNNRASCGLPSLMGAKNKKLHMVKCEGAVIIREDKKKKMMKAAIRFTAPLYGCIDVSAAILSSRYYAYQDDSLVKRICSEEL
ncbi:unnamed protein product [Clavelina lepadiformis]|uniref:Kazal-like domain-containing protein n=2 Tax=Clavelina lepadiformis TaxID=159417 RepID=A0ABP0GVT4_CLALP